MAAILAAPQPALKPASLSVALGEFVGGFRKTAETAPTLSIAQLAPTLVACLAAAPAEQRLVLEDTLVRHAGQTLPAVLAGLRDDNTVVRSRCAFVVIRMGRAMAGDDIAALARRFATDATLMNAIALIQDQWGGTQVASQASSLKTAA